MYLSVIVPIYGVENYIAKCASSLLHQTASAYDYEVIFINDGTKDDSIERLRETVDFKLHKNFHLFEKSNGGLSSARNYGLSFAKGDYVWFVDSDDWVDDDSVQFILSMCSRRPDLIVLSQLYENNDFSQSLKFQHSYNVEGSGLDALRLRLPDLAPLHICKRKFLIENNISFKEGILHEDSEFTPRLKYLAETCIVTDRPCYHYYMREDSIMHVVNSKRVYSYFVVLSSLLDFYCTRVKIQDRALFAANCSPHIYGLLNIAKEQPKSVKIEVNCYFESNRLLAELMKESGGIKAWITGFLLSVAPSRAVEIYRFLLFFRR